MDSVSFRQISGILKRAPLYRRKKPILSRFRSTSVMAMFVFVKKPGESGSGQVF